MIVRRTFLLATIAAVSGIPARGFSQASKIRRIGALCVRSRPAPENSEPFYDGLSTGLRKLGYIDGKNIAIEWRFADGQYARFVPLAQELLRSNVELIVTHSTPATQAVRSVTSTLPIVTVMNDPVTTGLAASLSHPGGNVTGVSIRSADLTPKQLEILKTIVPSLARVGFLCNPTNQSTPFILKAVQSAAQKMGVQLLVVEAQTPDAVQRAIHAMSNERMQAMVVADDVFLTGQRKTIATLALKANLPSMFPYQEQVTAGGLVSYGHNLVAAHGYAATFVDRILKGAKAGDLPFEEPNNFHLAINQTTARRLGVSIPKELLLRADQLIP